MFGAFGGQYADRCKALRSGGRFVVDTIELIEGRPEYLRLSWPTYLSGAAYERAVNATEWLAPFRVVMMGQLRKAG